MMSLFDDLKRNYSITSQMRSEQRRIDNLDWRGLENHLKEYHDYFLQNRYFPETFSLIKQHEPVAFKKLGIAARDNDFGWQLERYSFGILYLGWSVGVGLIDEQFPNEMQELNEKYDEFRCEQREFFCKKGLNNEYVINCFSNLLDKMFELGKVHGYGVEFSEFRPRRLY